MITISESDKKYFLFKMKIPILLSIAMTASVAWEPMGRNKTWPMSLIWSHCISMEKMKFAF